MSLDSNMTDSFEIIVGTYEQYLLGYKIDSVVNEYKMEKSFATHSHLASIRSIASNKHYLASAGADDIICLYDMRYRTESGKLTHHDSTVNCIEFSPEGSHLFTCSNDGSIVALRCGNWQMEKHWPKAHKGLAVNALAIHPTGKIALSTGMDGVLRTWDLIKGRQAYAINLVPRLKFEAKYVTIIKWSPDGEKYLLAVNCKLEIYTVKLAGIHKSITTNSKIICSEFLKDELIATGFEDGKIKLYNSNTLEHTLEMQIHDMRVKSIVNKKDILITASSSGEIKLWKYDEHSLSMLNSINCGTRITSLSLVLPCKNLVHIQEEVELIEEKVIKKKSKLRLKQEVIIEDEQEWEITNPEAETSKKKHKKKRKSLEKLQDTINLKRDKSSEQGDVIENPKKKKKLSKANDTIVKDAVLKKVKKTVNTKEKIRFKKKNKRIV